MFFFSSFSLTEFMLFHFYDRYTCDECNFVTKSCQDMERHRNAHNGTLDTSAKQDFHILK